MSQTITCERYKRAVCGSHKTVVSLLREKKIGCTNIFVFCGSGTDEHVTSVRSKENGQHESGESQTHTESVVCVLFQLAGVYSHNFALSLAL